MAIARPPAARDDLDFHRPRHNPDDIDPRGYQRLVANPFLAFACVAFSLAMFASSKGNSAAFLLPVGLGVALLAIPLVHVQCLDCGRTLSYHRCKWHACERVVARHEYGDPGWLRLPALGLQLTVLCWLFLIALIFGAITS